MAKGKKKADEVATEVEAPAEKKKAAGPKETTVAKGADEAPEGMWKCPHCRTIYRADMKVAQQNHLSRVHGTGGSLKAGTWGA